MIYVCDSIMGSGKSMSAIRYMNEHSDRKFIYITPYLEEAARIKENCPALRFVEPSNKLKEYNFKKSLHTAALIRDGRNIATTHQAFRGYTSEILDMVRELKYTLIIDENVDVLEKYDIHPDDIKLALDAGYIEDDEGTYKVTNTEYHGDALKDLFYMMRSRELIRITDKKDKRFFFWALPPDLITSFQEVFILTYLFQGQSLHHLLEIYNIPYEYIGIHKDDDGSFRFGEAPGYVPEYVYDLRNKIHILDNKKLNAIGDDFYALSKNWFDSGVGNTDKLKNNVDNCYRHIWKDIPADRKLWSTYKGSCDKLKGKGYSKSFLTFNAKATNKYRKRDALVYAANVFMNAAEKQFYAMHGIEVDESMYALSIAVQWIWRSAIRDGNDVLLYIPSKRMRTILQEWIDSFSKQEGGDAGA